MSAAAFSWLWPDRVIGKRESAKLRAEHNALVNAYCNAVKVAQLLIAAANANRTNLSRPMGEAIGAARALVDHTSEALCHINTEHPAFPSLKRAHEAAKAAPAMTEQELSTVLAALRCYQDHLTVQGGPGIYTEIAANCGSVKPLNALAVAALCERLNFGGAR